MNTDNRIQEISNKIFVVKDFISDDQAQLLINFIDTHQDIAFVGQEGRRMSIPIGVVPFQATAWNIENISKIKLSNFPEEVQETFSFIVDKSVSITQDLYDDKDDMHCSNAIFAKQLPNGRVDSHIDAEPGGDEHLHYSTVLYLNTISDGDINFPNLGISYHPNSKDLLIFKSNHQNSEHEVTSISETRYSVPIFLSKDKNCYIK
jgi:hypothetical protein